MDQGTTQCRCHPSFARKILVDFVSDLWYIPCRRARIAALFASSSSGLSGDSSPAPANLSRWRTGQSSGSRCHRVGDQDVQSPTGRIAQDQGPGGNTKSCQCNLREGGCGGACAAPWTLRWPTQLVGVSPFLTGPFLLFIRPGGALPQRGTVDAGPAE
jgi:hypothetical protein